VVATGLRLVFVALQASDLQASVRFYRDAIGVPLQLGDDDAPVDRWIGGTHEEFSWREGAYLHFAIFQAARGEQSQRTQVGFYVDDVEAAHAKAMAAGAKVLHSPREEPWGRTARYEDPDGNIVGLTQS
jgi:lactoylglutathione lyase